ncbi:MAG TPA: hypothetical protein PLC59_00515 [Bacteroidales bacterium]|jgi:hypothetical protein|nr:hypothetical protein [Bacteroidales bacterium]HQI44547.1 hypothetical protein [Bacteroidales bacterium]
MKTTWIIENFEKDPSYRELIVAAKELGYPVVEINGNYTNEIIRKHLKQSSHFIEKSAVYDKQCVMITGTIKLCKNMAEELKNECAPVVFSTMEKYKCSAYYSHFGPYLFNDKYCMMSLKEIVRQKYDVWGQYGKECLIFIRPDSGEKTFRAGLLDIVDLAQLHDSNKDVEHELMLVSTPKNILWEGRFVVSKQRGIIASSTYKFQGNVCIIPSVPAECTRFVNLLLKEVDYEPDPVFCYDICQDNDKNCWLMELTSFSSAGLYAMDKKSVIRGVSEIAEMEYLKKFPPN